MAQWHHTVVLQSRVQIQRLPSPQLTANLLVGCHLGWHLAAGWPLWGATEEKNYENEPLVPQKHIKKKKVIQYTPEGSNTPLAKNQKVLGTLWQICAFWRRANALWGNCSRVANTLLKNVQRVLNPLLHPVTKFAGLPIACDTFAKGFSLPVKGQPFCNIPEESEFKVVLWQSTVCTRMYGTPQQMVQRKQYSYHRYPSPSNTNHVPSYSYASTYCEVSISRVSNSALYINEILSHKYHNPSCPPPASTTVGYVEL